MLAAKLAEQVRVAGGAVCVARCFQTEKCVPFGPVSALVRQMADLPGFVGLAEVWISELARLAPELRLRYPQAPPALAVDDFARHRVCEATCRAGESVSFEQPLLLLVDNVLDADETTLALLHYYGRQANEQRTLLVCVARSGDGDDCDGGEFVRHARSFAQLQRLGSLEEVHLQQIARDVLTHRGLEAAEPIVQSLGRLAQGNPLHATELALAIPAHGGRPASDWLLGLADQTATAAESFERSATARIAAASAGARAVTAALAVAARPLAEHELLSVTRLAPAELASAVFELEGERLLRRDGACLGFAHDSYAEVADAALQAVERLDLHARLGEVFAESAARNPAARIEVALHLESAGRAQEARAHALAAAEFAGTVGAVSERAKALELVRRVSGPYDGEVAASLAGCYLGLRDFDRVDALCVEARAHADLPSRLGGEFRYLEIAADHHSGREPLSRVCAALEELLGPDGPGAFEHRSDALTLLMRTADKTGAFSLVRETARAQRRAQVLPPRRAPTAHSLFASAYVFAKYYWPHRALPLLEEARRQAEAEQNWELEHACRDGLGAVLRQLGRYEESIEQIGHSLALARRTLNPQAEATSLVNLAVAQMALGRFEAAAHQLQSSAHIDSHFPRWPYRPYRYVNQGVLALLTSRLEEAEEAFSRGVEEGVDMQLWLVAVTSAAGQAVCAQRKGDLSRLADRCCKLEQFLGNWRRAYPDRWMVEAALAWNAVLNRGDSLGAPVRLERSLRELARRDVDHWLRLELEAIRVEEACSGDVAIARRSRLSSLAARYKAAAILEETKGNLA